MKAYRLILSILFLALASYVWAGAAGEVEAPPQDEQPPAPPSIPGLPELPSAYQVPGDGQGIVEAYREFVEAARALVEDASLNGLERNAAGISSLRNTIADWKTYWSGFRFFPESHELRKAEVEAFLGQIAELDRALNQEVEALNKIIDEERVLTTEKYRIH